MKELIQELYDLGLEKFAGDKDAAKDFVVGFMKEAAFGDVVAKGARSALGSFGEGALKAVGTGVAGLGIGLGIHGISSMINSAATSDLRSKFQVSLQRAMATNPLLEDADKAKVNSYAETVFRFAPHVASDPNLLSGILAHIVQGEGVDITIMKTLTELESKLLESRKNGLFTPKSYV